MTLTTEDRNAIRTVHDDHRWIEEERGWSQDYPDNPMVDDGFELHKEAAEVMAWYARQRPFKGPVEHYRAATRELYRRLCNAYGMPAPTMSFRDGNSGNSSVSRHSWNVAIHGRSVLTALHEFGHVLGFGETGAVWWSVNTFRTYWPKSFAKLQNPAGTHMLVKAKEVA
jgi:hypothetical protein